MGDFMPHFTISTIKTLLIYILSRKMRRKKLLMCTFCPATRHRPLTTHSPSSTFLVGEKGVFIFPILKGEVHEFAGGSTRVFRLGK
jgi:hypothetical protein